MSIRSKTATTTWPSVFQRSERPMYTCNDDRNQHVWKRQGGDPGHVEWLMFKSGAAWYVMMCTGVLSLILDPIAGIVEASLVGYRREVAWQRHARAILFKKIIASPIQHLAFFAGNLVVPGLVGAAISITAPDQRSFHRPSMRVFCSITLFFGSMLGLLGYHLGQRAVGKLPDWCRPDNFTIFIDGGALDPNGNRLTDKEYDEMFRKYTDTRQEVPDTWVQFVNSLDKQHLHTSSSTEKFATFCNRLLHLAQPATLLEIPDDYDQTQITKAYRKWAQVLHPDKNIHRKEAAEILFKALCEAYARLKE